MPLSPHWRWKIDRWRERFFSGSGSEEKQRRPRLCPACGTLVGSTVNRCHQCGASLTFSMAAMSRSLSKYLPSQSPVTYAILFACCGLYGLSLLWTMRLSGFQAPSGGLGALTDLGAIAEGVLDRLGASVPLFPFQILAGVFHPSDLQQPWRLVTAVFLHGSILHIGFNMWVLMDIGPMIEELYGSAQYLFIFVFTGAGGYVLSSFFDHFSVGASGALLGLLGVMLALTMGRKSAGMQMLRSQIVRWLIYIAILGLLPGLHIDNMAHAGGFVTGFILGKLIPDRPPTDPTERKRAYALAWTAGAIVLLSFALMILAPRFYLPL